MYVRTYDYTTSYKGHNGRHNSNISKTEYNENVWSFSFGRVICQKNGKYAVRTIVRTQQGYGEPLPG